MAERICYGLVTDYPEHIVETVEVPDGVTLKVGDVITAETLVTGSKKVYEGALVTDEDTEDLLLIIDQKFVELADGRRIEGSNLLTDLAFTEGMKITAIRLHKDFKFEISQDSLGNTGVVAPAVDVFLVASAGEQLLQTSATVGDAKVALKIEAVATIPTGGNMSLGYEPSVIARVVQA